MTTFDPGARLAFTHGLVVSPRSTAFFASRPAATITDGFDVFVQLVIAAITTEPLVIWCRSSSVSRGRPDRRLRPRCRRLRRRTVRSPATTLRDGLLLARRGGDQLLEGGPERRFGVVQRHSVLRPLGPARLGSTVERSSSSVSEYSASGELAEANMPWAFA